MNIMYLNGEYIAKQQASLSVMDRAVLFGDALYEVIPVYHGKLVGAEPHLARLQQGERATQIRPPLTKQQWHEVFDNLITRNSMQNEDAMLYLQVSRGKEAKRLHAWSDGTQPTVFAYLDTLPQVDLAVYQKGKKVISQTDIRRQTCFIKSTALQVNTIMQHDAKMAGAVETILFRGDALTEGSTSNVFIVKDQQLITPIANELILHGVTRGYVIEAAKKNGINVIERDVARDEVLAADEVWLTSSTKEVYPIVQIDDHLINGGKTGELWARMIHWYRECAGIYNQMDNACD